jgi:ABC-type multidrug transport system fused ATPase/permease subunit
MLIFAFVMAMIISPKMSIAFAIIIPALAIGLFFIITRAHPIFKTVFKKYDKLNSSVQENVSGMRVVKAYVREDFEKKKFADASDDVCAGFTKAENVSLISPFTTLTAPISIIASFSALKPVVSRSKTTKLSSKVLSDEPKNTFLESFIR